MFISAEIQDPLISRRTPPSFEKSQVILMSEKSAPFDRFASLCQRLEETTSSSEMRDELAEFFAGLPPRDVKISSYFLLGRIGPKYADLDLSIGEKTAIPVVSRAFDLDEEEVERGLREAGDLGDMAESACTRGRSSLTLEEVYSLLHRLKRFSGSGSSERRADHLAGLLGRASAREAKYIVRIAVGSLRLGVGETTIISAFTSAFTDGMENEGVVEDGYNKCTDIGMVGESMSRYGLTGVRRFSISLGRPVKMMLAQRVGEVSEILEKVEGEEIAAEVKYDGERVQVHKRGERVQLFSRRLTDITGQYPDVAEYARSAVRAEEAVLDGEIVASRDGKILPFQELMQRRRKYEVEEYREKVPVVLILFDLIYLEGRSLLKRPYPERRRLLEGAVDESDDARLAERIVSENFGEIMGFFEEALERGFEGIIVKSTSKGSVYQPGKRGWNWIKWKREYEEGLRESFDVVVVGSYSGRGKRSEHFGALLCAVRNTEEDVFETFTRVGTGFSDQDFETIEGELEDYRISKRPPRLKLKKEMVPDQFYEPAVVIEIIGAEITRSPAHTAGEEEGEERGLALRFPRFLNIREDKGPEEATTVEEIRTLRG